MPSDESTPKRARATRYNQLGLAARDVRTWKYELQAAEKDREQNWLPLAKRMLARYAGEWYSAAERAAAGNSDLIEVNLAHSDINTVLSTVLNRPPLVKTEGHTEDSRKREKLVAKSLNQTWRTSKVQEEHERAAKYAAITGDGFSLQGFTEEVTYEVKPKTVKDEQGNSVDVAAGKPRGQFEEWVEPETVFSISVSPFEVLVDSTATTEENCQWICREVWRPLGDVMNDDDYSLAARRRVKATGEIPNRYKLPGEGGGSGVHRSRHVDTDRTEYVREFHVWDRRLDAYIVLADGLDDRVLMSEPLEVKWTSGDLPLKHLTFCEIPERYRGQSLLALAEGLYMDANKTLSYQLANAKRSQRIIFVPPGTPSSILNQIRNAKDGAVIKHPNPDAIKALELPTMNSDVYSALTITPALAQQVLGIDAYTKGRAPVEVSTAQESALVAQGTQLSIRPRQLAIERFQADVARQLWQLMVDNYTTDHVTRMVGDDILKPDATITPPMGGPPQVMEMPGEQLEQGEGEQGSEWTTWNGEDLDGDYLFTIQVGSSMPQDEAATIQKRNMVMLTISQSPIWAMVVDLGKLFAWWLEAFDEDADDFLLPPQVREQLQKQMSAQLAAQEATGAGGQQIPNGGAPPDGSSRSAESGGNVGGLSGAGGF